MPRIAIDSEVFEALAERARAWRDSPNDVLRALLGLPPAAEGMHAPEAEQLPGQLRPLISAGLLKPGESLTWYRRNTGAVHVFTVTGSGCLTGEDGMVHLGPNRAASHAAGYPSKGWAGFKTEDGSSLADLASHLPNDPASRA
jgi:hypothetical protein